MTIKNAPNDRLEGTETLLGKRYAEIRDELSSYVERVIVSVSNVLFATEPNEPED